MSEDLHAASKRPSAWRQTFKAVAWSFFGVRRASGYEDDVSKINPLHVIVAGVVAAILFVLLLLAVVHWVAAAGPS